MESRIFYINSRNRSTGTDGDFTYDIDLKGLKATHAVILQAYIPKSYYLIDAKNTFELVEGKDVATVTIDPGSYSRSSFKSQLQTRLNEASPNGWAYTISNPTTSEAETGKFTFAVSGNGGEQPEFNIGSNLWEQLGFDPDTVNTFESNSLTSTNVINLQSEQTLFIHSNLVQDKDSVLQEIYSSNSLNFSGISFSNHAPDMYAKPLATLDSSIFRFYLTDENSNPINLHGLNIVFTLYIYTPINWRAAISNILNKIN